mmetsp:Transcript_799/g.1732  ORF Transcript_799/g.1732 Transcript_799/m.1732 type:complete len:257 (-) Transcript_799:82-852(-)
MTAKPLLLQERRRSCKSKRPLQREGEMLMTLVLAAYNDAFSPKHGGLRRPKRRPRRLPSKSSGPRWSRRPRLQLRRSVRQMRPQRLKLPPSLRRFQRCVRELALRKKPKLSRMAPSRCSWRTTLCSSGPSDRMALGESLSADEPAGSASWSKPSTPFLRHGESSWQATGWHKLAVPWMGCDPCLHRQVRQVVGLQKRHLGQKLHLPPRSGRPDIWCGVRWLPKRTRRFKSWIPSLWPNVKQMDGSKHKSCRTLSRI